MRDYLVIRQKTTSKISKGLAMRPIVDYSDYYNKKLFGSFILSWVLRPGRLFYLGLAPTSGAMSLVILIERIIGSLTSFPTGREFERR
ncbi:MAG: hypothetical protein ACPLRA_07110 [Candidatus Saccharicenans sp.]